jgi:lipopolysaccharide transport system permease protein
MGILWSFLIPLSMLLIYTFVFGEIFKARWANGSSKTEFALVLLIGLIVFNLFSECVSRAPSIIVSNPNYVKKVIFPLEVLPWVALGSSLFHAVASLFVWLAAYAVFIDVPHYTILLAPFVLLPFCLFTVGISWFLASLGVYLRDVSQVIGVVISAAMFLSPIFYPATAVPEKYRFLLYLSPITIAVEQTRDVLYWGRAPDFISLLQFYIVSLIVACLGFAWFQKTRKGFADVL